jgi:hypothetical protein
MAVNRITARKAVGPRPEPIINLNLVCESMVDVKYRR